MASNHSRPRVGTIIWGAILLAFAAVAFSFAVLDLGTPPEVSLVWIVMGIGGVLVVGAIVAAIARAVSGARVSTGSTTETGSTASGGQPVD